MAKRKMTKGQTTIVTRVTRRVPHVEKELPTIPEYNDSPAILVGFVLLDL
jgi:hypothetical protein